MSTWPRRVLLACYEFPPSSGIGARRWAKLAKGLAAGGTVVDVLAAQPAQGADDSQWAEDVDRENIRVHWLPRVYPSAVSNPQRTLRGRIAYRLAVRRLRRLTEGTVYDTALGWDAPFLAAAKRLLREEPADVLLATGAPFHLLYLAAQVKQAHPSLRYVADYRDPWIGAVNYGMSSLTESQRRAELAKQQLVLEQADVVTAPNRFLADAIRSSGSGTEQETCRYEVIPHFYDPDDQPDGHPPTPAADGEIRLVYGGALYMGLEPLWPGILSALDTLQAEQPELYERVRIEIYSDAKGSYPDLDRHTGQLQFRPSIGGRILERIRGASAALLLLAEHNRDFLTTKFFEYMPCRRPYVVLGPHGHVAHFVEERGLGVAVGDPAHDLADVIRRLASGAIAFDAAYDTSAHALPAATEGLVELLQLPS